MIDGKRKTTDLAAGPRRKGLIPALLAGALAVAGAAGAEVLWSGLDQGLWRVHGSAADGAALALEGLPEGGDHGAPAMSPDGSRLAVEVTGAGVWACALDGGACEAVTGLPGIAARPAWNPVTGDLVFTVYRLEGGREESDLWIVDPDLQNPRPLVIQTGNQDAPDVSPDGRTLAYDSAQTVLLHRAAPQVVRHVWLMDLVTGWARPMAPGPWQDVHPDWSPDGRHVAFASDRSGRFEIWVSSAEGGEPRQVTSGAGSKSWPAWSPDGESLLFTRLLDGRSELMEVDAAGSEPRPYPRPALESSMQMRDPEWK